MTLQELADRLEIIEVCTRMHWCVDHRDWDGLGDLLADYVSFPTPAEMTAPGFDPSNYRRSRAEVKAAYPGLLGGLITQHLIAGHQVELDGDRAVCRAHSINVHLPVDARSGESGALVLHGNEYRFELERTPNGWRINARRTWIRWRWSTDYPHVEGGKDSKRQMYAQVAPLGETVTEKFFAVNARLLLPD